MAAGPSQESAALCGACMNGNVEAVKDLLQKDATDVNYDDTPLRWTATMGHLECAELVIKQPGLEINKAGRGRTALHAAAAGKPEILRLVLRYPGVDVTLKTTVGTTALEEARSMAVPAGRYQPTDEQKAAATACAEMIEAFQADPAAWVAANDGPIVEA